MRSINIDSISWLKILSGKVFFFLKAFVAFSVFFRLGRNLLITDMLCYTTVPPLFIHPRASMSTNNLFFPSSYPTSYWFQFQINCVRWRKMQFIILCVLWFQGWPFSFSPPFWMNHHNTVHTLVLRPNSPSFSRASITWYTQAKHEPVH